MSMFAQSTFTGTVVDSKTKQTLPGVNVVVQGATSGTSTGFDGKFTLKGLKSGDKVNFSYIGYRNSTITFNGQTNLEVKLSEDSNELKEVVVQVGYGSVKKKDATGSVSVITAKDFNKGAIVSTDQLLAGKAAGVRITASGGAPDSAPNIRIRGGSSLSNNNPLIVIDGIPISDENPAGISNPLSLVNPNDVESFTILKDASATAIFGLRASNGVIIITTKKGSSGKPEFNFSSSFTIGKVDKKVNVFKSADYVKFIQQYFPTKVDNLGIDDPSVKDNLSTTNIDESIDNPATPEVEGRIISNTDWQDQIFRTSISSDYNFSARANLYKKIPFRASVGYNNTQGLVKTNDYQRFTYSVKLTPKLLTDHLKVDINAKGTLTDKNAIDADGAIASAIGFDPTKPVYSNDKTFGGYYQSTAVNGNFNKLDGNQNPLATLEQRTRPERALRFLGSVEFDYKWHALPELRTVLNLGLDRSNSRIIEFFKDNSASTYQFNQANTNPLNNFLFNPGLSFVENQKVTNKTMDAYFVYAKNLNGFIKKFDIQGGYTYQNFETDGNKEEYQYNAATGVREAKINPQNLTNRYFFQTNTQAFFGRTNIDINGKYIFTASVRREAFSFFRGSGNVWGNFPSAAFAWKIKEESFLKNSSFIQDLKLRLGYGLVGNGRISELVGYYPASPIFSIGGVNSQYLPNVQTYNALPFNPNITWEKTSNYNIGLDFELFKNKAFSGAIEIYRRITNNLLAVVNIPAGLGLTNEGIGNVGSIEGNGAEFSTTIKLIQKDNFGLSLNGNVGYNVSKVTDLTNTSRINAKDGGIPAQTGVQGIFNAVGEEPFSALLFEQIYDANKKPIPGAFVDRNLDGIINNDDKYFIAIRPNLTFGFGLNVNYKNFDLSANFRGQKGGQVYNANLVKYGFINKATQGITNALSNTLNFYDGTADTSYKNFNGNESLSDNLLEDATFVRCDNITLGYKFAKFINKSSLKIYTSINNAFIITKYKGQDPENFNGFDNNLYPRPRMYTLGLSLDF